MKRIILTLALLLTTTNSHALILDTAYTGALAERIDLCGYGCGIKDWPSYESNLLSTGGSLANNSVGYAQQFIVNEETQFDYLLASARMPGSQGDLSGETSTATMYFKLYTGESNTFRDEPSLAYPDVSTASIVAPWTITSGDKDEFYEDIQLLFGATLQPGTYWIAQERYAQNTGGLPGQVGSGTATRAIANNISVKFGNHLLHTPEPATLFLFGAGLLAMARRRVAGR